MVTRPTHGPVTALPKWKLSASTSHAMRRNYNFGLFMVLDTIGLEAQNVMICQRAFEEVDGEIVMKDNLGALHNGQALH